MNATSLRASLSQSEPAPELSICLKALWYDARGDWNKAHELIQDETSQSAAWIHAFLHRKEGDTFNADYWYRKAGRSRPALTLEQEWEQIVQAVE